MLVHVERSLQAPDLYDFSHNALRGAETACASEPRLIIHGRGTVLRLFSDAGR